MKQQDFAKKMKEMDERLKQKTDIKYQVSKDYFNYKHVVEN